MLSDIEPDFRDQLQILTPMLLAKENVVLKEMNGQKVLCKEMLEYFKVNLVHILLSVIKYLIIISSINFYYKKSWVSHFSITSFGGIIVVYTIKCVFFYTFYKYMNRSYQMLLKQLTYFVVLKNEKVLFVGMGAHIFVFFQQSVIVPILVFFNYFASFLWSVESIFQFKISKYWHCILCYFLLTLYIEVGIGKQDLEIFFKFDRFVKDLVLLKIQPAQIYY